MRFSLYKACLKYLKKINDINLEKFNVIFSSRNGYRQYISLENLVFDDNTSLPYKYMTHAIIDRYTPKYLGHNNYELSKCGKYIDEYTNANKNELVKSVRFIKFFNKLLSLIPSDMEVEVETIENIISDYNQYWSNNIKLTNDMLLVVSNHPYDILGASTNRRWTSCIDLERGDIWNGRFRDQIGYIKHSIIYLIDKNDLNINNPYARFSTTGLHIENKGIYNDSLCEFVKKIFYGKNCK